jgi:hypothetical protein
MVENGQNSSLQQIWYPVDMSVMQQSHPKRSKFVRVTVKDLPGEKGQS